MCRVAYISTKDVDRKFLAELFEDLEKSAGGDGNGIGGFIKGNPYINKQLLLPAKKFTDSLINQEWDNGFVFHTRKASVGMIDDVNCHPFVWGDTITIHNGHIEGFGVLKLMMLENLDKYKKDGWTPEKIGRTTDSDILAYFIWKRGFNIVPTMDPGTVITMYPELVEIYVGYCLQAIFREGVWIYASDFTDQMGLTSDEWVVFAKESHFIVQPDSSCVFLNGYCVDGKKLYEEREKRKKKNKKKYINMIEVT